MVTKITRFEPTPYEEFVIERILESSGQQSLLDTIQQLSEERNALRARLAAHPFNPAVKMRLHLLNKQLKALWAEVRRVRAERRVQIEEALGIDPSLVIN